MNRITLLFILFSFPSLAQYGSGKPFVDFGPKIFLGPSMFKSNVVTGTEDNYEHSLKSFRWDVGFKFAFDFNDYIAIVGEAIYGGNQQSYNLVDQTLATSKKIQERHLEFPVMFRYNNSSAGYLEAGYVFGKILKVQESDLNGSMIDRSELYNPKRNGLVFGLGGWLWGNKVVGISGGVRFRYDLDNALATEDAERYLGAPDFALDNGVTGNVNPWSVTFNLEFNYDFGLIMAKSPCTGRRKVMINP